MADLVYDLIGVDAENLGWVPYDLRSDTSKLAHNLAVEAMPKFNIVGAVGAEPDKVFLWDPIRKLLNGHDVPLMYQATGSCVANGAETVVNNLQALDIAIRNDAEVYVPLFLGYHYGRGRFHSGINGRGEGSTGSGQAEAIREDGVVAYNVDGLPQPKITPIDGGNGEIWTWGAGVEMTWSDGKRIQDTWIQLGRKRLCKTTSPIRNSEDAKASIANYYPITIASDWGGMMQPPVTEGVLLNRRVTTWNHQMCILAYWKHPKLGLIFWIQNSWADAHGRCPSGAPAGGFWVKAKDVDYICSQGDSFAFSQWDGFPAQDLSYFLI
jgi:hypothetical protein